MCQPIAALFFFIWSLISLLLIFRFTLLLLFDIFCFLNVIYRCLFGLYCFPRLFIFIFIFRKLVLIIILIHIKPSPFTRFVYVTLYNGVGSFGSVSNQSTVIRRSCNSCSTVILAKSFVLLSELKLAK